MSEIIQFIAMPFDQDHDGIIAGESIKCATPASAVERAKGLWQVLGHGGAVALVRRGYPESEITVLRRFGIVPNELPD